MPVSAISDFENRRLLLFEIPDPWVALKNWPGKLFGMAFPPLPVVFWGICWIYPCLLFLVSLLSLPTLRRYMLSFLSWIFFLLMDWKPLISVFLKLRTVIIYIAHFLFQFSSLLSFSLYVFGCSDRILPTWQVLMHNMADTLHGYAGSFFLIRYLHFLLLNWDKKTGQENMRLQEWLV